METKTKTCLSKAFDILSTEFKELYPSEVEVLETTPDPLTFHRCYVSPNKPVVIRHAFDHWPAITKWTEEYLRKAIGNLEVTVAVTPNGLADAIFDGHFVMPEERKMLMSQFLDLISQQREEGNVKNVYYVQKQNSNLTDEFCKLLEDVDSHMALGTAAFGTLPDAVNFWMGDERAVTSRSKTFTLFPPTDLPFIPYGSFPGLVRPIEPEPRQVLSALKKYPSGVFKGRDDGSFDIVKDPGGTEVSWIAIDPLQPDTERYPEFTRTHPLSVTVRAGEMLYLPSLWFHHVQQSHGCIAVNYWYDMDFDVKWVYYKFLEHLSTICKV